jgi:hypothetical protein
MHGGFRVASPEHGPRLAGVGATPDARVDGHSRMPARCRARLHGAVRVRRRYVLAARRLRAGLRGRRFLRSCRAHRTRRVHLSLVLRGRRARPHDRTLRAVRGNARGHCRQGDRERGLTRARECVVSARHRESRRAVRPSSPVPTRNAFRRTRVPAVRLCVGTRPSAHRRGGVPRSRGRVRRRRRHAGALRAAAMATAIAVTRGGAGRVEAERRNQSARGDHRARSGPHAALGRHERNASHGRRGGSGDSGNDRGTPRDRTERRSRRERNRGRRKDTDRTASRHRRRGERRGGGGRRHMRPRRRANANAVSIDPSQRAGERQHSGQIRAKRGQDDIGAAGGERAVEQAASGAAEGAQRAPPAYRT